MKSSIAWLGSAVFATVLVATDAHATTRGKTQDGLDYATGGVTVSELRALAQERGNYSLWITTAAKDSGAFLSDARVQISDAKGELVLDTTLIGPWLFVDLEPGTYKVNASVGERSQSHSVRITANAHRQAVLYFDVAATLSPDWRSPFARSPYASD